jgi:hypothetical protein
MMHNKKQLKNPMVNSPRLQLLLQLDRGLIATKTKLIPISETASIQFTDTPL